MPRAAEIPIALTQGDPSGVGPDITLMAWLRRTPATPPFLVLADPAVLASRAAQLGFEVPIAEVSAHDAPAQFNTHLPVMPLRARATGLAGIPATTDAAATIEAIETAVALVHEGSASAVVTNPIAKEVLYGAGFTHPGHTEFLGELSARFWGTEPPLAVMMLWSDILAVVPVTIHIALAAVPIALTGPLIEKTATIVADAMVRYFDLARPRLAVAGLNPHAGEGGAMGREEIETIVPALDALRARGLDVAGPYPADTLFTASARTGYDVALAMYHDQALVPIKTLAFDEAVNVTLGLRFIRTSPDHGTAFSIAGTGTARPHSLLAALALAARMVQPASAAA